MTIYIHETLSDDWERLFSNLWYKSSLPRAVLKKTAVIDITTLNPNRQPIQRSFGESEEHFQKRVNDILNGYEEEWRKIVPDVVDSSLNKAEDDDKVCFIWAEGPMESCELPEVFPYIMSRKGGHDRYHIEGVTFTDKVGYCHSWISFEYHKESFIELMKCNRVDLEYTRLYVLIFDEQHVDAVIRKKPPRCIDLEWVVNNRAIAMSFYSHFEGCYIVGERPIINSVMRRIVDRLRSQDVDVIVTDDIFNNT